MTKYIVIPMNMEGISFTLIEFHTDLADWLQKYPDRQYFTAVDWPNHKGICAMEQEDILVFTAEYPKYAIYIRDQIDG